MWRDFLCQAEAETKSIVKNTDTEKTVSLATGTAAYPLIKQLADRLTELYPKVRINVYEIKNDFFGHSVTVAGLVTGGDLINQLKGKELGEKLLIPDVMLRSEGDLFLDSISLEDAEEELGIKITPVYTSSSAQLIKDIFS